MSENSVKNLMKEIVDEMSEEQVVSLIKDIVKKSVVETKKMRLKRFENAFGSFLSKNVFIKKIGEDFIEKWKYGIMVRDMLDANTKGVYITNRYSGEVFFNLR